MKSALFLSIVPKADYRTLAYFLPDFSPFQGKNHIAGTLEKTGILQPAYAALAVIKPNKLLRHFAAAIWTYPMGTSHHSSMSMPSFSATSSGEKPASLAFVITARMEIG